MTDTIELLETIGSDASLRYAATGELKSVLERAQVSGEFTMAAASGDGAVLRQMMRGSNQVVMFDPPPPTQYVHAFLDSE